MRWKFPTRSWSHTLFAAQFRPRPETPRRHICHSRSLSRGEPRPHGIVVDIGRAHVVLKEVLRELDYQNPDELLQFKGVNTTTEF